MAEVTQVLWSPPYWVAEVTDGLTWREVARGEAASKEEAQALGALALGQVGEIDSALAWGQALVRSFEAAQLKAGINADPRAALALDRYLREVSSALLSGRLHVAYAALQELLATPQGERPAGAQDAALVPVHDAIALRLDLSLWGA